LCTDYAHCQAYSDEKSNREKWKDNYDSFYRKIKKAVDDTCGEYLEYNDEIAITVFHSCSNGITEKASDVWGSEVDYLTNVVSEGDLNKNDYITETVFSKDEFSKRILTFLKTDSAVSDEYIGDYDYTTGNNIAGITFMGSRIKGTDVRKRRTFFNHERSTENSYWCCCVIH
jgi:stage II sporulation protein D